MIEKAVRGVVSSESSVVMRMSRCVSKRSRRRTHLNKSEKEAVEDVLMKWKWGRPQRCFEGKKSSGGRLSMKSEEETSERRGLK